MNLGFVACIPVLVLIVGILISKRMNEMVMVSSVLAAVLMFKQSFLTGYLERLYKTMSDDTYQLIIIILLGFGAIIKLAQDSGSLDGFERVVTKFANTRKKAMVATWIVGIIVFLDDYLNILTSSFSMKRVTDANKVPREHLAFAVNSLGGRLCVLIPVTSWAAFAVAAAKPYGVTLGTYISAIPFMFFPIIAVAVALLLAIGIVPKIGEIKKAYTRVDLGGPVSLEEYEDGEEIALREGEVTEEKTCSPVFFFIPIIVLVAVTIIMGTAIEYGIMLCLVTQFVLYVSCKKLTAKEFFESVFEGFKNMIELSFIILIVFMTAKMSLDMGMAQFLIDVMVRSVPSQVLPVMIFIIVGIIGLTADSWVVTVLTIPIFLPMATEAGISPVLPMAAILSGVTFGSMYCLFSDSVFMTSAGTGITNERLIRVFTPYVLAEAILAAVLFVVAGCLLL